MEDMGTALIGAIAYGREEPVKILLQWKERAGRNMPAYVSVFAQIADQLTGTLLLLALALGSGLCPSPTAS